MIYSVVDDRSGVAYQEYRCVYGEDVEAALRFLFNAMAPKPDDSGLVMQGIPEAIYCDNGPITKSRIFQRVLDCLGVRLMTHLAAGTDGRRVTARSKGKVERPFRTVKEAHETLYHFHKPENEAEANLWLHRYLASYNGQQHRSEPRTLREVQAGYDRGAFGVLNVLDAQAVLAQAQTRRVEALVAFRAAVADTEELTLVSATDGAVSSLSPPVRNR